MNKTISHSSGQRYLKCSYQWDLHYNRGIRKRTVGASLQIGRMIHKGLEAAFHYQWEKDPAGTGEFDEGTQLEHLEAAIDKEYTDHIATDEDFTDEYVEEVSELAITATEIARNALINFKPKEWRIETVEVLVENDKEEMIHKAVPAIELQLRVPVNHGIDFIGYIDLIATHMPTGYMWIIDHKSKKAFTDVALEETNAQFPLYQAALWIQHKMAVCGTMTYQIRNFLPKFPKVNKNGKLSVADIMTTWETYAQYATDLGLKPSEYEAEMKPKLAGKQFFLMTQHIRTIKQASQVMQEWANLAATMHSPIVPVIRNLRASWECDMCDYKQFCLTELRGEDTDFLLTTVYKKKGEKERRPSTLKNFSFTKDGVVQ